MKPSIIILLFMLLLFSNCIKEETTNNKFYLLNNSGVPIKILPTKSLIDTLILLINESKEYDLSYQRGLSTGISYAPIIDTNFTTVIFNNSDTIIHYYDTLTHTGRYYKPTSDRSFYNTASYEKDIVNNSKYTRTVTLKYIFTAQDYLDAKK